MLRLPSRQSVCSSCQLLLKVLQFSPHSRTLRSGIPVSQCLLMFSCLRCRAELSLQLCGIISLAFPLLALFTFTLATQKPQSPRTISKPRHHTHDPRPIPPYPMLYPAQASHKPQDPHTIEQAALCFGICICCLYPVKVLEGVYLGYLLSSFWAH